MKRFYHFSTVILLTFALFISGYANSSTRFKEMGDYWVLSTDEIITLAQEGDAFAQLIVSELHRYGGNKLAYSEELADQWYQQALPNLILLTKQDNAAAAYFMAQHYLKEERKNLTNFEKSPLYFGHAAMLGHPSAQNYMARKIENLDPDRATDLREKAALTLLKEAEQGVMNSQCNLAMTYEDILRSLKSTSRTSSFNLISSKSKEYWAELCYNSLKQKFAHINDENKPISFRSFIFFTNYSYVSFLKFDALSSYSDATARSIEPNLLKAYAVASYAANRFEGEARVSAQSYQTLVLELMTEEEKEEAKELAATCIANFSDKCY